MSLDDNDDTVFDQFKNKKTTYNENLYTTKIDNTKITDDVKRKAEELEKEILNQSSAGNIHLAEERNQLQQQDVDETDRYEEMKYSGVYRAQDDFKQSQKQYQSQQ